MKKSHVQKIAIVAAVVAAILAFKLLGFDDYLSLDYLKQRQIDLARFYAANPVLVIAAYMAVYIAVTALSLPGAVPLTLAGGAFFGLGLGTLVVSFASTIGATLACFVSRFILRQWVQNRFADKLGAINAGIEREGGFYLFTMRLVPVFPFFVINLVMGITNIRLWTFYWVSQLGMLPGTLVYVNAGKELGQINSLSGILSPGLIFSFVLLGIFPLAVKKLVQFFRRKKLPGLREE